MSDNCITMRGVDARIVWGYQVAAVVRNWTAVRSVADPGTVTATIVEVDAFRVSQHPLTFVVPHQHGVWRWPIATLQMADTQITARLGPPEEAHV